MLTCPEEKYGDSSHTKDKVGLAFILKALLASIGKFFLANKSSPPITVRKILFALACNRVNTGAGPEGVAASTPRAF
jgi:hypothetical protein